MTEVAKADEMKAQEPELEAPQVESEPMVPQSKVNELTSQMFHKGKQKGIMEALANQEQQANQQAAPQAQQSLGGMPQMTHADIERIVRETQARQIQEMQAQQSAQEMNNIKGNIYNSLKNTQTKHDDFDDVFGQVDLNNNPEILNLVHNNVSPELQGEVMYQLYKNPSKVSQVYQHLGIQPHHAVMKIKELADSIKQNEDATNQPKSSEPLSTVKPTVTGVDNGSRTISDRASDSRYKF